MMLGLDCQARSTGDKVKLEMIGWTGFAQPCHFSRILNPACSKW